jgi:hypothetical protein
LKFTRPTLDITLYEIPKSLKNTYWDIFKKHHYLSNDINNAARCFVAYLWDVPVAFNSVLAMPSGTISRGYRGHRLVVLSDYQGMGIGNTISETTGEILLKEDKRYFCKTANIKLGEYRNNSNRWRPTAKNMMRRSDLLNDFRQFNNIINKDLAMRWCYSHEYIGSDEVLTNEHLLGRFI